jgi:hypothetical protein
MYDPISIAATFWSDYFWWVVAPLVVLVVVAMLVDTNSGGEDR